jgi:hypothetical protein
MTEVWKPVLDYEDCYEVSDLGNLRRSFNQFGNPSGRPVRRGYNFGYVRHTISKDGVTWTR